MKGRLRDTPTRSEVSDRVGRSQDDMKEKRTDLEREAHDIDITRETLANLEGGTAEGGDEVRESIENAEAVTKRIFDDDAGKLKETHDDGKNSEGELQERSDAAGRDAERIEKASGVIDTEGNLRELRQARDHAARDREFLDCHIDNLDRAIQESEAAYADLHSRVHQNGGA